MSRRRSLPRRILDVLALLLVGMYAVSATQVIFDMHSWATGLVAAAAAAVPIWWFYKVALDVKYMWTQPKS